MFDLLREHDPVHWHGLPDGGGFWALTRYAEVSASYLDHATFLSSGGAMLGGSYRSEADTAAGRMLVSTDPPRHRLLRQQMHRAFSSEMVARVARQVESLVEAAVDRAIADGGCDFATDIGPELPAGALMVMMDIGHQDARALIDMTRRMVGYRDPGYVDQTGDERLRLAAIQMEIFEFFDELLASRRGRPGPDVISILAAAELNGRRLSEEEVLYNCMNVAVGGNETTSHTASSGLVALAEHPEQYQRLSDDAHLLDAAINEILRWSSTNAYVLRIAGRDTELAGRTIRRGDPVTLWNVSANRDSEQFPDPHRFDVARTPNKHLSYGNGIHRCIGAMLGHVELSILFKTLIDNRIEWEIDGKLERMRSNFILGINHLPVRMRRL
ncbi:cytochrome P450 [Micromonospora aurantiaca]|uniref:Cytochrome P450 n=2 Tax=Micromonospora aurantiaca (nom. illeg.) TaxID=47850 RepID=A0A3M9JWQ7_9ACTN|nr:cytochrome P450 [Micromonospora aurantiaca]AXH91497.1 cytochrome P450 [Micromonospora aurantiaca]RNH93054.1 cytochrome P450 [Micromonospora aurantiaca]